MSITQTYYLAHTARAKLSSEAARADHDLRLLVGHANLLDSLMLELAEAEREQESWFNHSVRGATKQVELPAERHITWADAIVEDPEEDWQAEDVGSDSDSDYDSDSDMDMPPPPPQSPMPSAVAPVPQVQTPVQTPPADEPESEYLEDDAEDYTLLSLVRTSSHSQQPPELSHDWEDDSSEDESMPPSPPSTVLPSFSEKQIGESFYDESHARPDSEPQKFSSADQAAFFDQGFFLPERSPDRLVSRISVY